MKNSQLKKFDTIVRRYKTLRLKNPDRHIDHCVQQKTLSKAIEVAAKAIDSRDKIHGHQTRMGRERLNAFFEKLILKESEIGRADSFDKLLSIIESVKCYGIAALTQYDTATRIGAYLNLFPDKIYLHAGTKAGAKQLLRNIRGRKFIYLQELPASFLRHGLTASEFEDILCIFKNDFKNLKEP